MGRASFKVAQLSRLEITGWEAYPSLCVLILRLDSLYYQREHFDLRNRQMF